MKRLCQTLSFHALFWRSRIPRRGVSLVVSCDAVYQVRHPANVGGVPIFRNGSWGERFAASPSRPQFIRRNRLAPTLALSAVS
jgi:hypothetical protein